jgi:hypothetical protein
VWLQRRGMLVVSSYSMSMDLWHLDTVLESAGSPQF